MRPASIQRASMSSLQNTNRTCQAAVEFLDCISFRCLKFGRSFSQEDFCSVKKLEFCYLHKCQSFFKAIPLYSRIQLPQHLSKAAFLSPGTLLQQLQKLREFKMWSFLYLHWKKKKKNQNKTTASSAWKNEKGYLSNHKETEEAVKFSLALFNLLLGQNLHKKIQTGIFLLQ